jgi:hypothetical protein
MLGHLYCSLISCAGTNVIMPMFQWEDEGLPRQI